MAVCQGVKKRVFEKKCALSVLVFFMSEKAKRKIKKKGKGNFQPKNRKFVFLGGCEEKVFFFSVQMSFFRKIGKHDLCSDGKKTHFRCNYLLLENGPLLWPFQVTKHYKIVLSTC